MTAPPVLTLEDVSLDLKSGDDYVRILRDITFEVTAGEIVGVVGESGSGKSMTALSILQLLPPKARLTAKQIGFDGSDLAALPPQAMRRIRGRRIGMVFQDPMTTLDPVVQVGRQIDEAYRIHHPRASRSAARAKTLAMLQLVGVPDAEARARQYPHQWSGGMRQRAVIAMALVNDPEVILADEPTTALDATIQAQVLDALIQARDELGVAVVLITHDLGVISQVASRVIVMYAGAVVEVADIRDLFTDSRHPYSVALIHSRPGALLRGEALVAIPGRPPLMSDLPAGCPFAPRCASTFKSNRCVAERPVLEPSVDGRLSACHYRDERQAVTV